MFSISHSATDVKTKLAKSYADYDFDSELEYTSAIIDALSDAKLLYILPIIGSLMYDEIADKNKVDLDETENYLYMAEVYYACTVFMDRRASSINSSNAGTSEERLKVEGYEYETGDGGGGADATTAMSKAIKEYYDKATQLMCIIGYNPHQLQRGGSVFG